MKKKYLHFFEQNMKILSINTNSNFSKNKIKSNFKAHPDFDKLAKEYNVVASSFSEEDQYTDILMRICRYY